MSNRAINMQLLVGLIFLATNSYADEIILNVNTKKPIAVTSEKFLSLTIDPITLLRGDLLTTNFQRSSKILKALSPAYLRFGGAQSNFYTLSTYSQDDQADSDNPFTEEHWMALQRWGERSGLDVISSISPQYANTGAFEEPMNSEKVIDLISFSDRMEYNTSWQIGYECQTRCDLSGADLGKYVTRLRNKLDSFPRYANSIIVGPDVVAYRSRQQQLYLQDYLTSAYPALSAITWHPNFAGATVSENGVIIHQDNLAADKEDMYKVINQATGKKPLWLAESKAEECKDQFLGALLWMRRLGNAAKIGAQVLMRNPTNPSETTPDYWVSLVHKTLVGREVLEVKTQAGNNSHVHFYGQCTKPSKMYEKGALTVFAVNLTPAKVTASLKGTKVKSLHEYVLQPGFDKFNRMFAKSVLLNNKPLRLTKDGDVPNLVPLIKTGTKGADFELPSGGIGFWVLPDAKIKSCMDHEDQSTEKVLRRASKQLEEQGRIGNAQGMDDTSEKGKTSEVTDERRRQRRKLQKHEEDVYEEKKSKKTDWQKYLELLKKILKRKLGYQEEKKPLILKGSYTLFPSNRETKENADSIRIGRFEEIKAVLEEYKNDFSITNSDTDAKTTTQALDLISKIENGIETLERGTDNITGNPEEKLVTSEKLDNINAQIKHYLEQLYRLLPDEQKREKVLNDENVSYNSLEYQVVPAEDVSKRIKRDIDGKFVEDFQNFRRDNTSKKRVRSEDIKDRRNDRQNRKKDIVRRNEGVTPYYDSIRSESNENNFHGFWRQEPLKSFPQGDIYLATGDSSEERNKDYEYIEDEEVLQDEKNNAKVKTLVIDYAEPDDTWVGDGSDHLGYVPNEFYEIVNIPNVHTNENLKDYGELWEAESLQKVHESEQVPKEDSIREMNIIPERRPIEKEEKQTKQKTAERLMKYYQDIQDKEDDDMLHEESESVLRHLESEEISQRLSNANNPIYATRRNGHSEAQTPVVKNGRIIQGTSKKVKPITSNSDDELIDFNSMHFRRELPIAKESQVRDRQYSRRPKRKIEKLDDIFHDEMVAQDDDNLKDCKCRVTRYNRLKRNAEDVQVNEEHVNEQMSKQPQTQSSDILENNESMLTASVIGDSDKKDLVDESEVNAKVKHEPIKDEIDTKVIQDSSEGRLQGATTTTDIPEEHSTVLDEFLSHQNSSEIEMSTPNTLQEESKEFFRGNIVRFKEQISPVNLTYHYQANSEIQNVLGSSDMDKKIAEFPETQKTSAIKNNEETGAKAAIKKRQSSAEVLMTNSSAEIKDDVESSNEEVVVKQEPSTHQKRQHQTSKPAKRFTDTKSPPITSKTTANRRLYSKSIDSSTKGITKVSQRAEELARIIESRLAARAEALEALKKENERRERRLTDRATKSTSNDSTRLQDSQIRRLELLNKLKEKLATRRERMLQSYRDELQRVIEKASDEGKRNIKRREVWEKFTESDNYKEMVDSENVAYVLTYKPVDYDAANTDRTDQNDITDKQYISVTEVTKPLHQAREKMVNFKVSPQISYDPNVMSYINYDELGSVKYPSVDEIIKSKDQLRNSERGSGKVYYSIVENLDEPRIFEYQPKVNEKQAENVALSIEEQSDKVPPQILYRGKEYTYNKSERGEKPKEAKEKRNGHYVIRPEQDTQIPLSTDQQLLRVTPTLVEPSTKERRHSRSGHSTSSNQGRTQYQVVYRLKEVGKKPHVPVNEQNLKIPSHMPKASGEDYSNDKFKNFFTPEERIQIIRLLSNVENEPHIRTSQQQNVEDLQKMIGGNDHIPRVMESFFTPDELKTYQIIQSSNTPTVRQQYIKIKPSARYMDERQVVYSLPESIASPRDAEIYADLDSSSEEDSEEYSQADSSTGRRVYVIDPSTYRGGDPTLQLHEDEIEETSTNQENSAPETLYRQPYKGVEQPSVKYKSNIQDFPIISKLPNGENYKQIVRLITNEKEQDEEQYSEPIFYIMGATKSNNEVQDATRKRHTQHASKVDETVASVEEISENYQSQNDNAEADYNNHQNTHDKEVITDGGVIDQTKNVAARDKANAYTEKQKRTATSENITLESEIVDDSEETKSSESYRMDQSNKTPILTTRKKRELRNRVKDDSLERMYPIISAQKINHLERNTKPISSQNIGFNENLTGYVRKKEKIFQLVQPDEYYKTLPLKVGKISDRPGINKQNIDRHVQEKGVSSIYPNFLSQNLQYQPQNNDNELENRETVIGILVPREADDASVKTNIKIVDQSSESEEYNSYSDSCEESSLSEDSSASSNSESPRQQAVLMNISDEHESDDEFETMLEDAERNRYRGKKLGAKDFPHLYDILKANNGNRQGLMMLLPLENSKLSRHRRQVVVENNEPSKSQILSKTLTISINEDTEDVTPSQLVEKENAQSEEKDDENIWKYITNLRKADLLVPKYITEKNRILKEFEEMRRNKQHTMTEEIIQNIDQNIKAIKYNVPVKDIDSWYADINENSIDADLKNFENDLHRHTQEGYEKIEGLSTYLENGIPKVENAIEMGLEKVKNLTGSVEHFIEDFDDKFNETLTSNERSKLHQNKSTSTPAESVFNTAIINVKKLFKFLSEIMQLLHT